MDVSGDADDDAFESGMHITWILSSSTPYDKKH